VSVSEVCPGREHDTTAARAHPSLLTALDEWTDESHVALADLSYEGENSRLVCPIKARAGVALTAEQRTVNALHATTRALAERGNAQLETTFRALRRTCAGPAPDQPLLLAYRRYHRCCAGSTSHEHSRTS
jgi:DDE superfamily endonuclease